MRIATSARTGARWGVEEERRLHALFTPDTSLEVLAETFGRSPSAIRRRLELLGVIGARGAPVLPKPEFAPTPKRRPGRKPKSGLLAQPFADLPVAVLDLETTGLHRAEDRILELGVVHMDGLGAEPEVVLDTLVNPGVEVRGSSIHGIQPWDVVDAPRFEDLVPELLRVLEGRVLVAHNASFDLGLLAAELDRLGHRPGTPPHLCTYRMARLLVETESYRLGAVAACFGSEQRVHHAARFDALATADVYAGLVARAADHGVATPNDLAAWVQARGRRLSSLASLSRAPWVGVERRPAPPLKQRPLGDAPGAHVALHAYRDELHALLLEETVAGEQVERLRELAASLELTDGQVRAMHARVFADLILRSTEGETLEDDDAERLAAAWSHLQGLGWAPGQAQASSPAPEPAADEVVHLRRGGNLDLTQVRPGVSSVEVRVACAPAGLNPDLSILLIGPDGRVRQDEDFVFYNQPEDATGAVRLQTTDAEAWMEVDVDDIEPHVQRVLLCASLDPDDASAVFEGCTQLELRVGDPDGDVARFDAAPSLEPGTRATILGELYRREERWKLRAVGQGFSRGLAALAVAHGVDLA